MRNVTWTNSSIFFWVLTKRQLNERVWLEKTTGQIKKGEATTTGQMTESLGAASDEWTQAGDGRAGEKKTFSEKKNPDHLL